MGADYSLQRFETDIFGAPVWRLDNPSSAQEIVELAREHKVALVSCRVSKGVSHDLKNSGFRHVETLVTLETATEKLEMPEQVFLSDRSAEQAEACAHIAAGCFTQDRYHADPKISDAIADRIKADWMRNSVLGRADAVLLFGEEGREGHIAGFNACMLRDQVAIIDLIGIDPRYQRRGYGKLLIQAMHAYYHGKASILRLGTQLSNEASQSFYQGLGFREVERQESWHWTPG